MYLIKPPFTVPTDPFRAPYKLHFSIFYHLLPHHLRKKHLKIIIFCFKAYQHSRRLVGLISQFAWLGKVHGGCQHWSLKWWCWHRRPLMACKLLVSHYYFIFASVSNKFFKATAWWERLYLRSWRHFRRG